MGFMVKSGSGQDSPFCRGRALQTPMHVHTQHGYGSRSDYSSSTEQAPALSAHTHTQLKAARSTRCCPCLHCLRVTNALLQGQHTGLWLRTASRVHPRSGLVTWPGVAVCACQAHPSLPLVVQKGEDPSGFWSSGWGTPGLGREPQPWLWWLQKKIP